MDCLEKVTDETLGMKNVLYLDWWDGNMGIFIYQIYQSLHLK